MKTKVLLFAFLIIIGLNMHGYAGIPVNGVVSGTWFQGDTMEVVGNLYLLADSTLTIEPGVVVKFIDYYRFYVYGLLSADGTVNDSIYFTCDTLQNPNKWGGIRFSNADSSSRLRYCGIENGLAQGGESQGGGVFCSNSYPIFSHCTFNSNHADDQGGAIAIDDSISLEFSNCIFSDNTANSGGGGIQIGTYSTVYFDQCTFNNNTANYGGAVNCDENSIFEFNNCLFDENYAGDDGGAIYAYGCTLTLDSCDIMNNHVQGYRYHDGGGIYADNCMVTLTDCKITGNYDAHHGGGMFITNGSLDMTNCMVSNDSAYSYAAPGIGNWLAGQGGGLYIGNCSNNLLNCTISQNSALSNPFGGGNGGGIFLSNPTSSIWSFCEFTQNMANDGGGMNVGGGWTSLDNCSFINNNTVQGTGENKGGGILLEANAGITITDCIFKDNTADQGGAIHGDSWDNASPIQTCTFRNNSADPSGGGAIYNGSDVTISECLFKDNHSVGPGGAIRNSNSSPAISKCTFVGNDAGNEGGGIYNGDGGSPNIERCTLYGNHASYGGGIASVSCSPTINSSIVDSSIDAAIYFGSGSSNSVVKYCNFNNNFPITFGGSDVPSGLGIIDTTNNNGDPCDALCNIFLDPLFVDVANGDFHLQSGSPCINAGDPALGPDPDGSDPEIGRYYHPVVGIQPNATPIPLSFELQQNYPNPFNPTTTIEYQLSRASKVILQIYNVLGEEVATLINRHQPAGSYRVRWNGTDHEGNQFTSGVFIYRITAAEFTQSKKMILIR